MSRTLSKIRWLTLGHLRQQEVDALLNSVAGQRTVNKEYVERIQKRREHIERLFWRLAVINFVLLGTLFLNAIVFKTELSIGGLSTKDVGKIKEAVLFVSSTLSVFVALISAELHMLRSIGIAWARKGCPAELLTYAEVPFGPLTGQAPSLRLPAGKHHFETKFLKLLHVALALLAVVWFLCLIFVLMFVYVVVIVDVAMSPSLPWVWSKFVLAYAIVALMFNLIITFLTTSPLPFRDYSFVAELVDLQKADPAAYKLKIADLKKQFK